MNIDWKKLWEEKIDYYEYQMSQLSSKYILLKNSFDYYVGLSENAISLLNYIKEKDIRFYICHKRINNNEKLDNFFNPTNFVVDSDLALDDIKARITSQCVFEHLAIIFEIVSKHKISL